MKYRLGNKGIGTGKLIASVLALFTITILFYTTDSLVTSMPDMMNNEPDSLAESITAQLVSNYNILVPGFILVIFLYMFTASKREDTPSRYMR